MWDRGRQSTENRPPLCYVMTFYQHREPSPVLHKKVVKKQKRLSAREDRGPPGHGFLLESQRVLPEING